jgi:hypothetical protein
LTKKLSVSIPDWIIEEVIGNQKNISARIQELIIKGYLAEKNKRLNEDDKKALSVILLRKL